jgi:hypothetical protein
VAVAVVDGVTLGADDTDNAGGPASGSGAPCAPEHPDTNPTTTAIMAIDRTTMTCPPMVGTVVDHGPV